MFNFPFSIEFVKKAAVIVYENMGTEDAKIYLLYMRFRVKNIQNGATHFSKKI